MVDFSINRWGNHLIMTLADAEGKQTICEATCNASGVWTQAEPIDVVNNYASGAVVGGVFMMDNECAFYFHANYPGTSGGFDIYVCRRTEAGWSTPEAVEGVNTEVDETYPALNPGEERIYFLRHQPSSDAKLEKKEADRLSIYSADRLPDLKWKKAEPINNVINTGYVCDVNVSADAGTLYYTLREDKKKTSKLMFTRVNSAGSWLLPSDIMAEADDVDRYSPQCKSGRLFYVRANNKKQVRTGQIICQEIDKTYDVQKVVDERGKVLTLSTNQPVVADLTVYNPTTLAVVGRYQSNEWDGGYWLTNVAKKKYLVDVRNPNYSYSSYLLDYEADASAVMPKTIEVFDTVQLAISVFDSEIFRPLRSKVIAVRQSDKEIFRSKKMASGKYVFSLPLGSNYNIIATANDFEENKFLFRLEGDIVFSYVERELPLDPKKRDFEIIVIDEETKEPVSADVALKNMNREEHFVVEAAQMQGKTKLKLREGDTYDLTVSGAEGYAFRNQLVNMREVTSNMLIIELIALKKDATVRLNNINFATASAELMSESFDELDRVVALMHDNPRMTIEVSAHTDNVGSAAYNNKLSNRRAQSVVDYLIESGVDGEKIVAKGYGMSQPIVPNTTEENRAMNRRVEFKILDFE